jgi:hypothetical protein
MECPLTENINASRSSGLGIHRTTQPLVTHPFPLLFAFQKGVAAPVDDV